MESFIIAVVVVFFIAHEGIRKSKAAIKRKINCVHIYTCRIVYKELVSQLWIEATTITPTETIDSSPRMCVRIYTIVHKHAYTQGRIQTYSRIHAAHTLTHTRAFIHWESSICIVSNLAGCVDHNKQQYAPILHSKTDWLWEHDTQISS